MMFLFLSDHSFVPLDQNVYLWFLNPTWNFAPILNMLLWKTCIQKKMENYDAVFETNYNIFE